MSRVAIYVIDASGSCHQFSGPLLLLLLHLGTHRHRLPALPRSAPRRALNSGCVASAQLCETNSYRRPGPPALRILAALRLHQTRPGPELDLCFATSGAIEQLTLRMRLRKNRPLRGRWPENTRIRSAASSYAYAWHTNISIAIFRL